MIWRRLADALVPPWAVGLSMPGRDKMLVVRYTTGHPSVMPRPAPRLRVVK